MAIWSKVTGTSSRGNVQTIVGEARPDSESAGDHRSSPVGRDLASDSPVGRSEWPVGQPGRPGRPVGRSEWPVGASPRPVGQDFPDFQRTALRPDLVRPVARGSGPTGMAGRPESGRPPSRSLELNRPPSKAADRPVSAPQTAVSEFPLVARSDNFIIVISYIYIYIYCGCFPT